MNHSRGEPTGEVNQWNNAQAYLGMLSETDWATKNALQEGKVGEMIRNLEIFYILLKRNKSKNKRSRAMFDEQKEDAVRKRIRKLHGELAGAENLRPTRGGIRIREQRKADIIKEATDIYEELGDYMYEEGLIFEKGIDPNRAWAQG